MADGIVPHTTLVGYVGQDSVYACCVGTRILSSTVGSPSIITTCEENPTTGELVPARHGFRTGQTVYMRRHVGASPTLDGAYVATVLSPSTFSIPVDVTVAGAEGYVTALTNSIADYHFLLTIQDSDTLPTFSVSVSGVVTDDENREFNFPLPSASAALIPVGTQKYDIWRIDDGFEHVYGDGPYEQLTERRILPP